MAGAAQEVENMDLTQMQTDPNSLDMVQKMYNENIATVPIQQPNVASPMG